MKRATTDRAPTQRRRAAVATALAILAASCTGGDEPPTVVVTTTVASTTTAAPAPDDGVLTVGVLVPLSGQGAELGESMASAVRLAVAEVNAAGGVLDADVRLLEIADEGDGVATASEALDELLRSPVDAVVGPASSVVAPAVLPDLQRAGILTCSPTAATALLDDRPDGGLFVRTIPSESMQAVAIAQAVEQTGQNSVALLYVDDGFGRPFAELVAAALDDRPVSLAAVIPFNPSATDFVEEASAVRDSGAPVVVVIGEPGSGPRVLQSVFGTVPDTTTVIVNDAMRVPSTAGAYQRLTADQLSRLRGVSPAARSGDTEFAATLASTFPGVRELFAVNAYDCLSMIALAAIAAESTRSADIAAQIRSVTTGGSRCETFAQCRPRLSAGTNIDYDGPAGTTETGTDGDPLRGVFEVFGYTDGAIDVAVDSILVTR